MKNCKNRKLIKKVAHTILKEAFWGDYTYNEEEIILILSDPSRQKERFFIFEKAFLNLKDPAILTKVFSDEEIKSYLKKISPHQRFSWLSQRIKVWRNIFLGEKNEIPRAKWRPL
ncbi:hypothetical protein [Thermodesulfatator autotrophicus]|uniref:Uncharacterized protein n=1 Tax=Thermodesulfatator autotrophicus TaxID=1795632 RepID=A0A177E9A0_9BACT|nr:hypothetical protein [Thermodesulfatator autotrophicus]OAG27579.1 hypothetical protein TH606_06345 [Thermodesulfatator autotrophicus]